MSIQDDAGKKQSYVYYVNGVRQVEFDEYTGSPSYYYTVEKLKARNDGLAAAKTAFQKQHVKCHLPETYSVVERCNLEEFFKKEHGKKLSNEFCSEDEGATLAAASQLRSILYKLENEKQAKIAYLALSDGCIVPVTALKRADLEDLQERAEKIKNALRDRQANKNVKEFEQAYVTYQASPKYTREKYVAVERSDADERYKIAAFATLANEYKKLAVLHKAIEATPESYIEKKAQDLPEFDQLQKSAQAAYEHINSLKGLSCYGRCTSDYVYRQNEILPSLSASERVERDLKKRLSENRLKLKFVQEKPVAAAYEYRLNLEKYLEKNKRYMRPEEVREYEKIGNSTDGELRVFLTEAYQGIKANLEQQLEYNCCDQHFFKRAASFLTPEKIATLKDIADEPVNFEKSGSNEELTELSNHVISGELTFTSEVAKSHYIQKTLRNVTQTEASIGLLLEQCPATTLSDIEMRDLARGLHDAPEQLQSFAAEKIAGTFSAVTEQTGYQLFRMRSTLGKECSRSAIERLDSAMCEYGKAEMLLKSSDLSEASRSKAQFYAEKVEPVIAQFRSTLPVEDARQLAAECWKSPLIKASLESRLINSPEELQKLRGQLSKTSTPTAAVKRSTRF